MGEKGMSKLITVLMIVVLVVVQAENPLNPSHKTSRRSLLPPSLYERFPPLRLLSPVIRKGFSLAMRECGITCLFACLKCHFHYIKCVRTNWKYCKYGITIKFGSSCSSWDSRTLVWNSCFYSFFLSPHTSTYIYISLWTCTYLVTILSQSKI